MKRVLCFSIALLMLSFINIAAGKPQIVSVEGDDAFSNTIEAVELFGGMQNFVEPGDKVGILVNSGFREKGAYVNPDVVIAALKMVFDAGAEDVVFLQHIKPEYWERSSLEPDYREYIDRARTIEANEFPSEYDEENFVKYSGLEGAVHLEEIETVREIFEVDVFINIPIAKNHGLTLLTNSMKNMMGLNTRATNVKFHLDGPSRNDPDFLAQCIADLNLVRKPDLIISDVMEVIVTNGPGGPGDIVSPNRVVAGFDPVAVDAYCADLVGFFIPDVLTIQKGYELGLGNKNYNELEILETKNE